MSLNVFTPREKKINLYSDLRKDLVISPLSNDITTLKDEDAVKESMRNLVLTDQGERLMQPNLGAGLKQLLFENMTPAVLEMIRERVKSTLELYEPRASIIDLTVSGDLDSNEVYINVVFFISNREQPVTLDLILERTR
jgi:phage baseplate assembly protein W